MPPLPDDLVRAIFNHLNVEEGTNARDILENLIIAYTRRVPWESASRIARMAAIPEQSNRPQWPEIFWQNAIAHGTGGTCFESNLAFLALLQSIGYEGYLTINNMGETIGCHTAIILHLNGERWLVDMGIPLFTAIPLIEGQLTQADSPYHRYTVRPVGDKRYEIERSRHPKPIVFTLIHHPIDEETYRAATTNDYGECGLFLDKIIINRVVQGDLWRFSSLETPYHLQCFRNDQRTDDPLTGDVPAQVAAHFEMNPEIVRAAFAALNLPYQRSAVKPLVLTMGI